MVADGTMQQHDQDQPRSTNVSAFPTTPGDVVVPSDEITSPLATTMTMEKPLRLLNLYPELRNRVYELYYEDEDAKSNVELNSVLAKLPEYNLTQVSHQLRSETLGYYKDPNEQFWITHTFA